MKNTLPIYQTIALETLLAASACACLGLIIYGTDVLSMYYHKFVFISEGLTGAFTFYTLRRLRARDTIAFLLVLFLFQTLFLTRSYIHGRALMDFIYFSAVPVAVAVFFWSYRKHRHEVKLYDPLILGAFCAVTIAVARTAFLVQLTLEGTPGVWELYPLSYISEDIESFLIGAGLGVGLWVIDLPGVKNALHISKGYVSQPASPAVGAQ
jgi:hypothetical protein